ncbi:MAG: hypothetical protein HY765_09280 [Rhodomicrobium sp.]|nr:hypothetical protein [Rhodomicrobium sp.]
MTKVSNPLDGSPFTPRHVRLLKISIAIMTALLILGILALVYGMARQASRIRTTAKPAMAITAQAPYARTLDLGQGQLEVLSSGDLLILHWKAEGGGDIILTFDPKNGHELGRIQVPHR